MNRRRFSCQRRWSNWATATCEIITTDQWDFEGLNRAKSNIFWKVFKWFPNKLCFWPNFIWNDVTPVHSSASLEVCTDNAHTVCKNIWNTVKAVQEWILREWVCVGLVSGTAWYNSFMSNEKRVLRQSAVCGAGELMHRRYEPRDCREQIKWFIHDENIQQMSTECSNLHENGFTSFMKEAWLIMMTASFCMRTVTRGQRARRRNCNYELMCLKSMCACQILGDCFVRR